MTQNHQTNQEDLYHILGVDEATDKRDIKRAYKKLAQKYHPDKNESTPESEEKFKQIKYAYDILSNPEKRAAYDRGEDISNQQQHTKEQIIKSSLVQMFLKNIKSKIGRAHV